MKIDNIITLSSGVNYLLLNELKLESDKYFFCVKVSEDKKKPINEYCFVKENIVNGKLFAKVVNENKMIEKLYSLLVNDYQIES